MIRKQLAGVRQKLRLLNFGDPEESQPDVGDLLEPLDWSPEASSVWSVPSQQLLAENKRIETVTTRTSQGTGAVSSNIIAISAIRVFGRSHDTGLRSQEQLQTTSHVGPVSIE